MRIFEIWLLKNTNGRFKYSNDEGDNEYRFCTEQSSIKDAVSRVKEIFKNKYSVESFLNEEYTVEKDYLFTVNLNGKTENFIMFENV